jgi:DNA invertase Pin-like site-specific DNA recombinase
LEHQCQAIRGQAKIVDARLHDLRHTVGIYAGHRAHAEDQPLKATEQPIDTSTAVGKAFLDMLGVFAEFETNLRRERQLEGIAKANAAGIKPMIDAKAIEALRRKASA